MNVAADALSRNEIGEIAWFVRELTGCDREPFFPIVQFIEWVLANPDNDIGMELEILEPQEMKNTYGTTNTGSNIILYVSIFAEIIFMMRILDWLNTKKRKLKKELF